MLFARKSLKTAIMTSNRLSNVSDKGKKPIKIGLYLSHHIALEKRTNKECRTLMLVLNGSDFPRASLTSS